MDCFDMRGQTVFVTGASQGLGRFFAESLAKAGANLVLGARKLDKLEETAASCESSGVKAMTVSLDVTDPASIREAVPLAWERMGAVDVLINNAGVAWPSEALRMKESVWETVLDTNLKGAFLMAKECAQAWIETDQPGNIVNIASIAGLQAAGQLSAYSASKAGLISLTKSLALEWARYKIRVNALAPGYILTDMNRDFFQSPGGEAMRKRIPQRRIGELSDLEGPLRLLVSGASAYMTGSVLVVDGGHLGAGL